MKDNKNAITALVFSVLMIISPMAGAANVSTFSGGDSEVTVEVRDGPVYSNIEDGKITLPAGDTVTSASMSISTDMATHSIQTTINAETAPFVWDPQYNNQQTDYSNKDLSPTAKIMFSWLVVATLRILRVLMAASETFPNTAPNGLAGNMEP